MARALASRQGAQKFCRAKKPGQLVAIFYLGQATSDMRQVVVSSLRVILSANMLNKAMIF